MTGNSPRLQPRHVACLALGGVWLLFFAEAIFTTRIPVARDLLMTEIPLRVYLRERLVAGQFPGWFPYEMLGVPFAGTVIASLFHPRTLLFILFDAAVSTKWSLLLAYLAGLSGAYRLARQFQGSRVASVTGAIVFALSGCAISYSNKTNMLLGLMTAPWMLAAVWRLTKRAAPRDVVSLAVWWALIFIGGEPQMFLEVAFVAGGLLLAGALRSVRLAQAGGAVVAASMLAAILLTTTTPPDFSRSILYAVPFVILGVLVRRTRPEVSWLAGFFVVGAIIVGRVPPTAEEIKSVSPTLQNGVLLTFAVGCLLLVVSIRQRVLLAFVLAGILASALSGAELLPSLGIGDDSIRAYWTIKPYLAQAWALHPMRFAELVVPRFIPDAVRGTMGKLVEARSEGDFFVEWVFLGGAGVSLALLGAWQKRPARVAWLLAAILGLWLATGSLGGLIYPLWSVAPFFAKFRYPEKYVGVAMVALVPLIAWGVDALIRDARRAAAVLLGIGVVVVVLASVLPAESLSKGWMSLTGVSPLPDDEVLRPLMQAWSVGLLRLGAAIVALGGVALAITRDQRAFLVIPAIVFVEIWSGNSGHLALVSKELTEDKGEIARILAAERRPGEPPPRVLPAALNLEGRNLSDDERVRLGHLAMQADDSTRSAVAVMEVNDPGEQWRVMRTFYGQKKVSWDEWMARFGVCYRVASDLAPPDPTETPISPVFERGMTLVRRNCLARAYFARAEKVEDAEAAQARMREGLPLDTVVWENGPAIDSSEGSVEWVAAEPEYLKLNVNATRVSALVVSETFATGWTATLDGNPIHIYATNAAVRGVAIPQGKHVLEMQYRPPWQWAGILLSLLGILGCVMVARRKELPTWDQFAPRHRATLALGLSWVVFFFPVIFTSRVLFDRDLMLTEMPLRQYMAERLASGEIPQWFPYEILGLPFSGSLVASPFHPQAILHLLFSVAVAMKWRILLAYVLGLAGMYRLIRLFGASRVAAVGGAWAFAFSGYAISVNNDIPFLMPMCTAPWLYASMWRLALRENPRDVAAAGLWWALLATGGDAQLFVESGLVGLGLLVAASSLTVVKLKAFLNAPSWEALPWRWPAVLRTPFARFTGSAVIASLLCSAEVLPGFLLRNENERAAWKETRTLAKQWAIHPYRYLDFFIPRFTTDVWREEAGWLLGKRIDYFAFTVFIGATVAVIICVGLSANLRRWKWALGAALSALLLFVLSIYFRGVPFTWGDQKLDWAVVLRFLSIASIVVGLIAGGGASDKWRLILAIGLSLLFSFWLSTGYWGGALMQFWKIAPPFTKFRYPEKYLAVFVLMLGPLTAWGIDAATTRGRRVAQVAMGLGGAVLALAFMVPSRTILKTWMQWTSVPVNPNNIVKEEMLAALARSWETGLMHTGVAFLVIGGALLLIRSDRRLLPLLPLLIFADLALGNGGRMPLVDREIAEDIGSLEHSLATLQRARQPPLRVFSARPDTSVDSLPPDERIAKTHLFSYSNDGARGHVAPFDINSPSEEWRVLQTFFGPQAPAVGDWIPRFNVCYRIATEGAPPTQEETIVPGMAEDGFQVVKHDCQSRAYLASAIPVNTGKGAEEDFHAAGDIMRPGLPRNQAVWEKGPGIVGGGGGVHWVSSDPERLEMEVSANAQSALVVSDAYALGWTATVDGVPTPIYATNGAARGVVVPEGKHVVVMTYNAPGLTIGLWCGALGLLICLGLLVLSRRPPFRRAVA